ncbi:TonB-dependent receptor plug domain-containing protein [Aliikangiella coralliicola]|uniref:TonB-dependent receptor n=1 Tax=Aliikangiella coralliicola TaxID=2592383 RepID=A0A545UGL5_9GAMM|nr:TonB-dependent receptor [Aliikangiella coralliicola]TQV88616.1 TonB-dependent receptor [Aliikangiella coralliicola]
MRKFHPVSFAVSVCISATSFSTYAEMTQDDQQKIIITGSHVKRIDNESSSPLVIISKDEIARSGATTLADLLQTTVYSNGASLNNQQTGGFTPGAASYNLRGLRTDRTLVLVDGRRLPSYPFGQDGNIAFVDLNIIPLAEVESVEILKDGASAVYGSDAISGVVNVITKREHKGSEIAVKTTQSDSNYNGNFISYLGGFSGDSNDLIVIAELQDYQALLGEDLDESSRLQLGDLSSFSFPGTYITSDANSNLLATAAENCERTENAAGFLNNVQGQVCVNDWAKLRQLIPENQRASVSVKWNQYFGDSTFYAGISANQIETSSDVPFGLVGGDFFIAANSAINPLTEDMFYRRGFSELGLQTIETESRNYRFVAGIEGFISDFDYDVALSHGLTEVKEVYSKGWMSVTDRDALFAAVNNGEINPFNPLSQQQIDNYTSQFNHDGRSYHSSVSGNLSGELAELESGTLYFASGIEFRREFIRDSSDQAIIDGNVVGLGNSSARGDRDISALFAEFIIPATEELELNLAVRYDDYSDFGSSVNPKVSFSYAPNETLLVRASWGTGFRAPNLFELHTDQVSGSAGTIPFVTQGNPDLDAETSESFNLGIVFDIDERFMASFDLWQIDVEDIITNLGVNTILNAVDESGNLIYENLITFNPDNSIAFVTDPFLNIDSQKAQGIDITSRLSLSQSVELQMSVTHLLKLQQDNKALNSRTELDGEYLFPENRFNASLIWDQGDFEHVLSAYYTGSHGTETTEVEDFTKLDYRLNYQYHEHAFTLMVSNLADEEPPVSGFGQWPYFEQRMYSPLGRTYSLQWTYAF